MNRLMKVLGLAIILGGLTGVGFAGEKVSPYLKAGDFSFSIPEAVSKVKAALVGRGFEVVGEYSPEKNEDLRVLAYTRADLKKIAVGLKDRGALASVLKVGFVRKNGTVSVSLLNPTYLFYAYLGDHAEASRKELEAVSDDAKAAVGSLGKGLTPFGGEKTPNQLKRYHFMATMPRFNDPVALKTFASFQEGLATIRRNLDAGKGNTVKVYEVTFPDKDVALFGVGLADKGKGEAHFLPIIGEDHLAALPYEILLQDDKATILHGKYRFALHWPELTMGTFMKIMSTPGDVERALKSLTE